ncbi:MAG: hypothetical protein HDQ98_05000 [Lachnospiraceae bacterium]|nr:hypothetical protein [Lachnospiraceae bacterium]
MRRKIQRVIAAALFWALLAGTFVHLTYIYRGGLSHTRKHVAGFYDEEEDSLDVIIIGTSATFSAFMPMEAWNQYGMVSYNFSINTLYTDSIKYYVREALKTQSPKLLVIDIAPFLFGHHSFGKMQEAFEVPTRYNTDGLSFSKNRFDLINEIVPVWEDRLEFYFDLFYYHGDTIPQPVYAQNRRHTVEKGYDNLPIKEVYESSGLVERSRTEVELDEANKEAFLDLLEELQDYDFPILFVSQPYLNVEGQNTDGLAAYMERVIGEHGFAFLNMTDHADEIGIDPKLDYSLDYLHYNTASAEKITAYLGQYIMERYPIPDRRADEAYRSWHEDYAEWQDILEDYRGETERQRMEVFGRMTKPARYLDLMQSNYYSCCIWIPAQSPVYHDAVLREKIEELGVTMQEENSSKNSLIVIDHSADKQILYDENGEFLYGSTFGEVRYLDGTAPELSINYSDYSYFLENRTVMGVIVAERATGKLIDFIAWDADEDGYALLRHETKYP